MILLPVIWFAFWIVVALAAGFVAAALMSAQPDNGGVVTRDEAGFILGITETEFTTWLEAGTDKIPQMVADILPERR